MDFGYYTEDAASLAVALVNTEDVVSADDHLASQEGLDAFRDEHGLPPMSEADRRTLRGVRSQLREVFAAESAASVMQRLNALLAEHGSQPRLVDDPDDQGIHLHFEPAGAEPGRWVAATATVGLALLVAQTDPDRLGICRSPSCRRAYLDRSKNRGKLFCSTACARRASVAAFRQRQRDARLG